MLLFSGGLWMVSPKDTARKCISHWLSHGQWIEISLDRGVPIGAGSEVVGHALQKISPGGKFRHFSPRNFPSEILPSRNFAAPVGQV